ncbi:MAG: hypothetical protein GY719_25220 [bacterium]|nr:hypothetical protein [bacterium]
MAATVFSSTRARRLAEAGAAIEAFEPGNWSQRHLRALLLSIIAYMRLNYCEPGKEEHFDEWWLSVDVYRRLLESRRLVGEGAQSVLREALALRWKDLEQPAVVRRILEGPKRRRQRRRNPKRMPKNQSWYAARRRTAGARSLR